MFHGDNKALWLGGVSLPPRPASSGMWSTSGRKGAAGRCACGRNTSDRASARRAEGRGVYFSGVLGGLRLVQDQDQGRWLEYKVSGEAGRDCGRACLFYGGAGQLQQEGNGDSHARLVSERDWSCERKVGEREGGWITWLFSGGGLREDAEERDMVSRGFGGAGHGMKKPSTDTQLLRPLWPDNLTTQGLPCCRQAKKS